MSTLQSFLNFTPKNQGQIRLVCFPFAGGAASTFRFWKDYTPENIELFAAQLPGREFRRKEQCLTHIDDVVKHLLPEIKTLADKPLVFFGYSMGGLVAYELVKAMYQAGLKTPVKMIFAGRGEPIAVVQEKKIYHFSDADFIRHIASFGGTPDTVLNETNIMQYFLPILKADFQVLDTYETQPPFILNCPIHAYVGNRDTMVSVERVECWRHYTNAEFSMEVEQGGHFFMNDQRERFVPRVIKQVEAAFSLITSEVEKSNTPQTPSDPATDDDDLMYSGF